MAGAHCGALAGLPPVGHEIAAWWNLKFKKPNYVFENVKQIRRARVCRYGGNGRNLNRFKYHRVAPMAVPAQYALLQSGSANFACSEA